MMAKMQNDVMFGKVEPSNMLRNAHFLSSLGVREGVLSNAPPPLRNFCFCKIAQIQSTFIFANALH